MKRILIFIVIFFVGMTAFSQDMSYFTSEYMRVDGTFNERLGVLEAVRDSGITGLGDFYHEALKFLLIRAPDIRSNSEQLDAEKSAIILCQGLGAEKRTEAAAELWQVAVLFDVSGNANDGNPMRAALIALGQVDNKNYVPHIVRRLDDLNNQNVKNPVQRSRNQMAVLGCISALEALQDIRGFRPVFFASRGPYDLAIKEVAAKTLPNIVDDPSEEIINIIRDFDNAPDVKLAVWREMFKTNMPDSSKAKVAAAALDIGWIYQTQNRTFQTNLRELRKSALETMRQVGFADDSVYTNLEKSYANNFATANPDYDEIMLTLNALTAVSSEQSVELIHKFLREINGRRRTGPWGNKERRIYEWLLSCIGKTGTRSIEVRLLLTTMQRNNAYTPQEQNMAANALKALGY